tara:strand:- start:398 stop:637 length:240 start_codon:yes stop_codon:yes gene_type:complete
MSHQIGFRRTHKYNRVNHRWSERTRTEFIIIDQLDTSKARVIVVAALAFSSPIDIKKAWFATGVVLFNLLITIATSNGF